MRIKKSKKRVSLSPTSKRGSVIPLQDRRHPVVDLPLPLCTLIKKLQIIRPISLIYSYTYHNQEIRISDNYIYISQISDNHGCQGSAP
jgi:hypothetical protein